MTRACRRTDQEKFAIDLLPVRQFHRMNPVQVPIPKTFVLRRGMRFVRLIHDGGYVITYVSSSADVVLNTRTNLSKIPRGRIRVRMPKSSSGGQDRSV